jgi:hypothetical protein
MGIRERGWEEVWGEEGDAEWEADGCEGGSGGIP